MEVVHPSFEVRRACPNTTEATLLPLFASLPETYFVPEKYLVRIRDGRIIGKHGAVVLPDGSFSVESVYNTGELHRTRAFHRRLPIRAPFLTGNHYSLLIPYGVEPNY